MSDFLLPDIGEGIVECEVVEWRVAEGDQIEEDQPIVEVMTDKALVEITAHEAGVVTKLYVAQGQIAKVHAPLYAYQAEGEVQAKPSKPEDTPDASLSTPTTTTDAATGTAVAHTAAAPSLATHGKVPASPAVRRLVREHQLKLTDIAGSGKDGRVLKEDVLAHLEQPSETGTSSPQALPSQGEERVSRVEPLRGVRAVMAKRMVESASTIPHFHYGEEIDVTALLAMRERLKPLAEAKGKQKTAYEIDM